MIDLNSYNRYRFVLMNWILFCRHSFCTRLQH